MNKPLLVFIFLSLSLFSNAQKDLRDGFIFIKGDSIKGKLNFHGDIKNGKECSFYIDGKTQKKYKPFEIDSYLFVDAKYYVSKYFSKKDSTIKIFAEYLVKGEKDLFYYRDFGGYHFLVSINDSTVVKIPYKEKIVKINGKLYQRASTQHIGFLKSYFSGCPSVYKDIESLKQPDFVSLIDITKAYHDEVCGENSCIVYHKKKKRIKIGVEPYTELAKGKFKKNEYYQQYGCLVYFWLPNVNEKLYFKTGAIYSSHENEVKMYKIPIRFEYLFQHKTIFPKFNAGVTVYNLQKPSYTLDKGLCLSASGGFIVKFSNNFYLDLNIDTDIMEFSFETDFFLSHSFGAGVLIMF